ncbi:hypothetical protein SSP531S_54820 [Streptomyces spongiicola]|uniref:Uncharacterized protein n=1 Tax=Streptomyces spongiicola TaxID=1690221 RepID=A0A388T6W4_9ACTN|nr:hypothetical protein [Streptomyces spongiicola]GBQ03992.1 hypothetical protein SSP531S_54820 [Streptomyces spongiicola]
MDQNQLRDLLSSAVEAEVCSNEALDLTRNAIAVESGEVTRENLLNIYRRRLRRTEEGSALRADTQVLISFLESYPGDTLNMLSVKTKEGGSHLFLTNPSETEVLHWMRMFSR